MRPGETVAHGVSGYAVLGIASNAEIAGVPFSSGNIIQDVLHVAGICWIGYQFVCAEIRRRKKKKE